MLKQLRNWFFGPSKDDLEFWVGQDKYGNTLLHLCGSDPRVVGTKIPAGVLTEENLMIKNNQGVPVIYDIINAGRVGDVPAESLTAALFDLPRHNNCEITVLKHAVDSCNVSQLPVRLFEHGEGLNDYGYEVLSRVAKHGTLATAPAGLITSQHLHENYRGMESCFRQAAKYGGITKLPLHLLTTENLATCDSSGTPIFHDLIGLGFVKDLPVECFTVENLLIENHHHKTVFQQLCFFDELKYLPAGFIEKNFDILLAGDKNILHNLIALDRIDRLPSGLVTAPDYLRRDGAGATVIHVAAEHGKLRNLPAEVLTDENLRLVSAGSSVYHTAAMGGCLNQIPRDLLTAEILGLLDRPDQGWSRRHSVLAYAVGANSKEFGYDEFIGSLLTVENLAVQDIGWGKNIMEVAVTRGKVARIPTTLPVPDSYKQFLDVPLPDGSSWWDAHVEHMRIINSLTSQVETPDIDIF